MKQCPRCNRTYTDETLNFCLDDGSTLANDPDESRTAILPAKPLNEDEATRLFDGVPTGTDVRRRHKVASNRNSLIAGVFGILLVTTLGVGSYWLYGRAEENRIASIAVMPFVNETGDPNIEYLSDGMTETLIGSLSQLPNLKVKARSSVFRYKGKELDPKVVGRELGVQAVLNGRVLQQGQEIVLYLELVDPGSEDVLWKSDYNRPMTNLVGLQKDIARDVADRLRIKLSGNDGRQLTRNYTENTEAYQLYLKGLFHWNRRTKTDLYKAIDYYRQAAAADPTYALAYAGLADAYVVLQGYDAEVTTPDTAAKAKEYALKALSLDDSLSEAHASVGLIMQHFDHDFAGAERELKRAIELNPNHAANQVWYALLLAGFGRFEEGETHIRRALEIEPASPSILRSYGTFLQLARRYDESAAQLKRGIELDPNFILGYVTLANTYMLQGKHAEAVEQYIRFRELSGDRESAEVIRRSFAAGGWPRLVRELDENPRFGDYRPNYVQAAQLISIGEPDKAIAKLEKAYDERETFLTFINVDPRLDALRNDPRFIHLQEKIGVPKSGSL